MPRQHLGTRDHLEAAWGKRVKQATTYAQADPPDKKKAREALDKANRIVDTLNKEPIRAAGARSQKLTLPKGGPTKLKSTARKNLEAISGLVGKAEAAPRKKRDPISMVSGLFGKVEDRRGKPASDFVTTPPKRPKRKP